MNGTEPRAIKGRAAGRAAERPTDRMPHGNGCMHFRRRAVAPEEEELAEKIKDTSAGAAGPITPTQNEEVAVLPASVQLPNVSG